VLYIEAVILYKYGNSLSVKVSMNSQLMPFGHLAPCVATALHLVAIMSR